MVDNVAFSIDHAEIVDKIKDITDLQTQIRAAMREAKKASWTLGEQDQFKLAIAAVGWIHRDDEKIKAAIKAEVRVLQALAFSSGTGIVVDWEQLAEESKSAPPSLGLLKTWHAIRDEDTRIERLAKKTNLPISHVKAVLEALESEKSD